MATQYVSMRNLKFTLHEVLEGTEVTQFARYADHDAASFDMVLDTAQQLGDTLLYPISAEMDRQEPQLREGRVTVHPRVGHYLRTMGEAGLIGATADFEHGGQQFPEVLNAALSFVLSAANNTLVMFTGLSSGSARLIASFGSQELRDAFLPNMMAGKWQGTMALTEPQAGSSLSDITSLAIPTDGDAYLIKGQKVFISAGDHDQADNVIHLFLARIQGAPAGTKGISLFVVPKYRRQDGQLVDNDVTSMGIYHKMGQKGTPAMHLGAGDKNNCHGYLVGEANKGLAYMFQMMNEARIGVGITGASIASAAYYASLAYARERPQSRRLNNKDALNTPQTPIINHPDVKRMLLLQKAIVEGSLSLILECAKYGDLAHGSAGDEKARYELLLDLLTPVAKTYPCEAGITAVSNGLQVFGGYGYCEDFPLEQLYRDIRICTIYEGTTGIQSQDLLGRKVTQHGGKAVQLFAAEVTKAMEAARTFDALKPYAQLLQTELQRLQRVTMHLLGIAQTGDTERFLADATLYMELFGTVTIAWQWLKQGTAAQKALVTKNPAGDELAFYESKLHTMKFFFHYELPKTQGLATRLTDGEVLTIASEKEVLV